MTFKILIETVIRAYSEDEARAKAKAFLTNPNDEDQDFSIGLARTGYPPNAGSYRAVTIDGAEKRDRIETECEKMARSHGWVQTDGAIYKLGADRDISYDSWTECCHEEGITSAFVETVASASETINTVDESMADRRVPRFGPGEGWSPALLGQQDIRMIQIDTIEGQETSYIVGIQGDQAGRIVDRIEACTKPGMHADIPYLRVWSGDHCIAEFCQHHIVGVYYVP